MWLLVKRYLGWYLWLGSFTTFAGAIIGCALFGCLIFFFLAILMGFKLGLIISAPVNLVILPIAFHLSRASSHRASIMRLSGGIAGCATPVIAILLLRQVAPQILPPGLSGLAPVDDISLLPLMGTGIAAGIWCGWFFERRGDNSSIFDVNAGLEAARNQK